MGQFRIVIIFIFLCVMVFNLFGQENIHATIVEADGYAYLAEDKTIRQIREEARNDAKKAALEKGGMYITNIVKVENYVLVEDKIEARSEGFLKILEYKDYGVEENRWHYWIKGELRYLISPDADNSGGKLKKETEGPLTVNIRSEKNNYKLGDQLKFYLSGNKDFFARVIYIDAQGNKLQLIPNKYKTVNFFKGNKTYTIPGRDDQFNLPVLPPLGSEKVIVYASTAQLGNIQLSDKGDLYGVDEEMKAVEFKTRGVQLHGSEGAEFFETNCKIKTSK